jgi:hypothetical protein
VPGSPRHDGIRWLGGGGVGAAVITSDLDIYRTASVLIREHRDEADLVAAQRADSFLDAGDMDGSASGAGCSRRSKKFSGRNREQASR